MKFRLMLLVFLQLVIFPGCNSTTNDFKSMYDKAEIADKKTFEILKYGYARDSITAYFAGRKIPNSDGPSFSIITPYYSKDRYYIYYCDNYRDGTFYYTKKSIDISTLKGVDPESFEIINNQHFMDKTHVYRMRQQIKGADPKTFTLSKEGYAYDKRAVFYRGYELWYSNGPSFKYLGNGYAKDRSHVYHNSLKVDGADASSFELTIGQDHDARDNNRKYKKGNAFKE